MEDQNPTPTPTPQTPAPQAVPSAPVQQAPVAPVQSAPTDVMGIISIILFFVGFSPIGLILGLVGMSSAKKNNRPTTLSKIGTIINAIGIALILLFIILIFINNISHHQTGGV